jgi:hypothetical protein
MQATGYAHFGGKHGESAALKNLLAHAGVVNPSTGEPFTEALCFGIAGGIGAGYSFCPSIPRHGMGSGVTVVGRHLAYATDAAWYAGCFDRLGIATRITETTSPAKAYQNLLTELNDGRPAVVWCSRTMLPFLGDYMPPSAYWMHSFIVYAVDETRQEVHGADRAPTKVTLSLDELQAARNAICSHKNRTLTIVASKPPSAPILQGAVRDGLRACATGLLQPRIKTFGLAGLDIWIKMITNATNKDGWHKVFKDGLLYCALREVYLSIETVGSGGGLYRGLYADFLTEAATILKKPALADLVGVYRALGEQWTELADAALPARVKVFKQTREAMTKQRTLLEEQGEKAAGKIADLKTKLLKLEQEGRAAFPLSASETAALLESLRDRLMALTEAETRAAEQLQAAV